MGKRSRRRVKPPKEERVPFVARCFEGLPAECDWVALREIVPAATAEVTLGAGAGDDTGRVVRVCTLLPGGVPGLVRDDGAIWLGLQVQHNSADVSRDLAEVVRNGLQSGPGSTLRPVESTRNSPRLQELIDPDSDFSVQVREGFDFWVEDTDEPAGEAAAGLEAANEAAAPTVKLDSVQAAYWTKMADRRYLRWVLPHPENRVLTALARLRTRSEDHLGPDTRLIGMFRAHGLLVPVWEMDAETPAEALEEPIVALDGRLQEALADDSGLSQYERSAREGLASRQLTIR